MSELDKVLTPDDAIDVYEKLLPAQNHSYVLGLKFRLPNHVVEAIHSAKLSPDLYLLEVITEFTKQSDPRPTWRVIIEALRSPAVRLHALAKQLENSHLPPAPPTPPTPPTPTTNSDIRSDMIEPADDRASKKLPHHTAPGEGKSIVEVRREIRNLHGRFNSIKRSTIQLLERLKITVMTVAFMLTSIEALDDHKLFLRDNYEKIHRSHNHWELFGWLNFYWNYLTPDLLHQLLEDLKEEENSFSRIVGEMEIYQKNLELFRTSTTLDAFCKAEPHRRIDPPPDFRRMVVEHDWPMSITLKDVEMFRLRLLETYDLKRCAMMVKCIRRGSFKVTWFVHIMAIEMVRNVKSDLFQQFNVTRLEILSMTTICVYRAASHSTIHHSHTRNSQSLTINSRELATSVEELDDLLIQQPSLDFFCPVTMGLLLQPHLTSCCGNHLSQEAADRIQGEGRACPICKEKKWSTVLNKNFQRQTISLRVFCRYRDGGCRWQGELATFHRHLESCPLAPKISFDDKGKSSRAALIPPLAPSLPPPTTFKFPVSLDWRSIEDIPSEKLCWANSVVVGGTVYFGGDPLSHCTIQYNFKVGTWSSLPKPATNTKGFAITSVNNQLVLVGGSDDTDSCKITLYDRNQQSWINPFPSLPTGFRSSSAAAGYQNYLIVAGGFSYKNEVDVLDTSTGTWYSGPPLSIGGHTFSSAVIDDCWFLSSFGGWSDEKEHIFWAHLPTLISNTTVKTSPPESTWNELPTPPVARPSLLAIQDQLLLVGGIGYSQQIYHYDSNGQEWHQCGELPVGLYALCTAFLPSGELIIAGGFDKGFGANQRTWIANIF